jgi:hypothetical protein
MVEGCGRESCKRDCCETHYQRLRQHGDVRPNEPIGLQTRQCKVETCIERAVYKTGWCASHQGRWNRNGDVNADVPLRKVVKGRTKAQYTKEKQQDLRGRLEVVKLCSGCVDCGINGDPRILQFDHLPGEDKVDDVSSMVGSCRPWEMIAAELAKCDVVCANCHRIRTELRRGDDYNEYRD